MSFCAFLVGFLLNKPFQLRPPAPPNKDLAGKSHTELQKLLWLEEGSDQIATASVFVHSVWRWRIFPEMCRTKQYFRLGIQRSLNFVMGTIIADCYFLFALDEGGPRGTRSSAACAGSRAGKAFPTGWVVYGKCAVVLQAPPGAGWTSSRFCQRSRQQT